MEWLRIAIPHQYLFQQELRRPDIPMAQQPIRQEAGRPDMAQPQRPDQRDPREQGIPNARELIQQGSRGQGIPPTEKSTQRDFRTQDIRLTQELSQPLARKQNNPQLQQPQEGGGRLEQTWPSEGTPYLYAHPTPYGEQAAFFRHRVEELWSRISHISVKN